MYSPDLVPATRGDAHPALALTSEPASLSGIFASQPIERFHPGEAVFWERDPAAHVFQLVEGCLRKSRILADGRRAITGFLFPGDVLGFSAREQFLYTAEAATAVKLRRVARRRFEAAVDGSARLRPQLLAMICDEMLAQQDQMILLGRKTADERVASFLLTLARWSGRETPAPVDIELPVSRLDMADYLGLTIETVSRTISKLKRVGLIALKEHRTVCLRRPGELKELAGEMDEDGACRGQHSSASARLH